MSPLASRSRLAGAAGFTLLELMLVLVILAVTVGLMIPRFRDRSQQELESHAKRLIMTFRLLRSEAILHEATYRLNYDLDGERYWITTSDRRANLDNLVTELGSLARRTQLPELIEIRDVALPMHDVRVNQGEVYTEFYPDGTVDPTVIHLATERTAMTLFVDPMNNRLMMNPGYHEIPYN
ncbi:MAG TPA: prepilin-type N-terminal cleavage/methylation domain-containing protein [Terriglobales bacterium]|nr:prepilin-type N-terminal cleavage/methylation domain-containing protein [Terriglobales bacterium]